NFRDFLPGNVTSVGVTLHWELFDWGRKRHELNGLDLAIERSNNDVHELESAILIEVDAKYRKLEQARQQLRIGRLAQAAAQENVRVATNRYRAEVSLMKDVLQAQNTLEQAASQYQEALSSFW